ncbi:MAG: hypothetical protein ACQESR_08255, partial [Planctomycetota bacterium]
MESGPTQAVLPLVGLAANQLIRAPYLSGGEIGPGGKRPDAGRPPVGRTRGKPTHPRPVSFRRSDWAGWKAARRRPSSRWSDSRQTNSSAPRIFQAVGLVRVESGPTQAVLPLVGLAANQLIRAPYLSGGGIG